MTKLTKKAAQLHQQAEELVSQDRPLTEDQRWFVMTHWQESSTSRNALDSAFFTPVGLARDLSIEIGDRAARILDLGAGIGRLSFAARRLFGHRWNGEPLREFVCVEANPDYVRVGKKVLPEATWICADIFDLPEGLGRFDYAISNPPFGSGARPTASSTYRGSRREYHVLDVASRYAAAGVVLLPQDLTPFRYSGRRSFEEHVGPEYERFQAETGLTLEMNCGIDTTEYADQWRGVRPGVLEIACCDFEETSPAPVDADRGEQEQTQLALLP